MIVPSVTMGAKFMPLPPGPPSSSAHASAADVIVCGESAFFPPSLQACCSCGSLPGSGGLRLADRNCEFNGTAVAMRVGKNPQSSAGASFLGPGLRYGRMQSNGRRMRTLY